ncbi:MAG: hypothetical protein ACTSU5_07455 [Promethearchaeota archaeon]
MSKTGPTFFHKIVGSVETSHELVGGAFTGIGNLTSGLGFGEISTMFTDIYLVTTFSGQYTNGILVVDRDADIPLVEEATRVTVEIFEREFADVVLDWDGNVHPFAKFPSVMQEHVRESFQESVRALAFETYQHLTAPEKQAARVASEAGIDLNKIFPPIFKGMEITGKPRYQVAKHYKNTKYEPRLPAHAAEYWDQFVTSVSIDIPLTLENLPRFEGLEVTANPFLLQIWGVDGEGSVRPPGERHRDPEVLTEYLRIKGAFEEFEANPPAGYVESEVLFLFNVVAAVHHLHEQQEVKTVDPDELLGGILENMGLPDDKVWNVVNLSERRMLVTRAFERAVGSRDELVFMGQVRDSERVMNSYMADLDTFNLMLGALKKLSEEFGEIANIVKEYDGKLVSSIQKQVKNAKKALKFLGVVDLDSHLPGNLGKPGDVDKVYDYFSGLHEFFVATFEAVGEITTEIGGQILAALPVQFRTFDGTQKVLDILEQYVGRAGVALWES